MMLRPAWRWASAQVWTGSQLSPSFSLPVRISVEQLSMMMTSALSPEIAASISDWPSSVARSGNPSPMMSAERIRKKLGSSGCLSAPAITAASLDCIVFRRHLSIEIKHAPRYRRRPSKYPASARDGIANTERQKRFADAAIHVEHHHPLLAQDGL